MQEVKLEKNKPVHLIGGGGVGMSGLGHLLLNLGYQVSASDRQQGPYLLKLSNAGAKTWIGANPENIPSEAIVFYSSAIRPEDPERFYCIQNNIPVFPRHGLLKEITNQYYTIGISGTHGKTTTTGWTAFLFECAKISPNALVGGTITSWGSNFRKGDGKISGQPLLVIEADESDESFLHISTREAIITNIELDHVDNYKNFDHVKGNFKKFIENCDKLNGIFFPSFELDITDFKKFSSYKKTQDLRKSIEIDEINHCIKYSENGDKYIFKIGLKGKHNLWNASAVLLMGLYHGFTNEILKKALFEFNGVERRMQIIKNYKNSKGASIDIIDDYAHHPTEIKAVLETLIQNNENIIAIWEPHRVSRFLYFNGEFHESFKKTLEMKNLFLMDIYDAAGEKEVPEYANWREVWEGWINSTNGLIPSNQNFQDLAKKIDQQDKKTTVVFLGAGNSSTFAKSFASKF